VAVHGDEPGWFEAVRAASATRNAERDHDRPFNDVPVTDSPDAGRCF